MVANTMFNVQINKRLKDIKGSSITYGGVSIVAIGDLFQLQPVMDGTFPNLKCCFIQMLLFKYQIIA